MIKVLTFLPQLFYVRVLSSPLPAGRNSKKKREKAMNYGEGKVCAL